MNEITKKMLEETSIPDFWLLSNGDTVDKIKRYEEQGADLHVWEDYIIYMAAKNLNAKAIKYLANEKGLSLTNEAQNHEEFDVKDNGINISSEGERHFYGNALQEITYLLYKEFNPKQIEDFIISIITDCNINDSNILFDLLVEMIYNTDSEYQPKRLYNLINWEDNIDYSEISDLMYADCIATFGVFKYLCDKVPKFIDSELNISLSNAYISAKEYNSIEFEEETKDLFNIMYKHIIKDKLSDEMYIRLGKAFMNNALRNNKNKEKENSSEEIMIMLEALYKDQHTRVKYKGYKRSDNESESFWFNKK